MSDANSKTSTGNTGTDEAGAGQAELTTGTEPAAPGKRYVPKTHAHADVSSLLEEIDTLVGEASRLPLGLVSGLDLEKLSHLVMKARADFPKEIQEATATIRERERREMESKAKADRLVEDGRNMYLADVQQGRAEADRLLATARADAEKCRDDASSAARAALAEADAEAERVLTAASEEAELRVSAHEITRLAQERAAEIIRNAERAANELRFGATQYVSTTLTQLQQDLVRSLREVEAGLDHVEQDH